MVTAVRLVASFLKPIFATVLSFGGMEVHADFRASGKVDSLES